VTSAVQAVALAVCALGGLAVVTTRNPFRQAMVLGLYGVSLAALCVTLQAPDVALSYTVVGTVVLPLMILLTLARVRRKR
jgi:uncharacterized MnhB-related membrane protein